MRIAIPQLTRTDRQKPSEAPPSFCEVYIEFYQTRGRFMQRNGTPKSGKYAKKKKAAPRRRVAAAPTARRSMRHITENMRFT